MDKKESKILFERWGDWDEKLEEAPIGGMGGWFNGNLLHDKENPTNHVWEDYVEEHKEESLPYLESLKEKIISEGLEITGAQHQNGYCPVFSDGKIGRFSYRAWGDFMAAVYSTKEEPLTYMAYYM